MTSETRNELIEALKSDIKAIEKEIAPFAKNAEIMGEWYSDRVELIEAKQWRINNLIGV